MTTNRNRSASRKRIRNTNGWPLYANVMTLWPDDGKWYRAQIFLRRGLKYNVYFTEDGEIRKGVEPKDIKSPPADCNWKKWRGINLLAWISNMSTQEGGRSAFPLRVITRFCGLEKNSGWTNTCVNVWLGQMRQSIGLIWVTSKSISWMTYSLSKSSLVNYPDSF